MHSRLCIPLQFSAVSRFVVLIYVRYNEIPRRILFIDRWFVHGSKDGRSAAQEEDCEKVTRSSCVYQCALFKTCRHEWYSTVFDKGDPRVWAVHRKHLRLGICCQVEQLVCRKWPFNVVFNGSLYSWEHGLHRSKLVQKEAWRQFENTAKLEI